MQSIRQVLKNFNPLEDKYVSREFQSYGVFLAEKLEDDRHKALYIKLAKTQPRPVLEEALRFVVDSGARRRGALFMWKLKELGILGKKSAQKGEIVTTLTILSLVVTIIGGLIGVSTGGLESTQSTASRAASFGGCGSTCSKNGDCSRTDVNSDGEVVNLACDMKVRKCLPATGEKDRCDDVGGGGNCGDICRADRDCNQVDKRGTDSTDDDIRLHCDFSLVGGGRGKCAGFPNGRQCPAVPTPTPRPTRVPATAAPTQSATQPTVAPTATPPTNNEPTPIPGRCDGQRFSTTPLSCGGIFRVCVDPVIDRITIRGNSGSFVLDRADEVNGSTTGREGPAGYRVWMSHNRGEIVDNIKIDFRETQLRHGRRAIYLALRSGGHPDPDFNQDAVVDMYYYENIPAFVFDGTPKEIVLDYHVTFNIGRSNQRSENVTQTIRSNGCAGIPTATPTITPTATTAPTATVVPTATTIPTVTFIPTPGVCGSICQFDRDCTGAPNLVCYSSHPFASAVCRRRGNETDEFCRVPTATPTATNTPPPTATPPIPTATPTPCDAQVHFLIDASKTIQDQGNLTNTLSNVSQKIRDYFADPAHFGDRDKLKLTYQYFNYDVNPRNPARLSGPDYAFPAMPLGYTNIEGALARGRFGNTILITDGIPSVADSIKAGSFYCVFGNVGCMSGMNQSGANRCENVGGTNRGDTKSEACLSSSGRLYAMDKCPEQVQNECKKHTYEEAYQRTKNGVGGRQADYGYVVVKDEFMTDVVAAASKSRVRDNLAQLPSDLKEIIDNACGRNIQPIVPSSLPFSFSLNNASAKTVAKLILKICEVGSTSCVTKEVNVNTAPGERISQVQTVTLPSPFRSSKKQYSAACELVYIDGSFYPCSARLISLDDGVRFDLEARDEALQSGVRLYSELSDVNCDGAVNAFDFSICVLQVGEESAVQTSATSCKTNPVCKIVATGDKITTQDLSVVIDNFGRILR